MDEAVGVPNCHACNPKVGKRLAFLTEMGPSALLYGGSPRRVQDAFTRLEWLRKLAAEFSTDATS
jgi:hypothetical protein